MPSSEKRLVRRLASFGRAWAVVLALVVATPMLLPARAEERPVVTVGIVYDAPAPGEPEQGLILQQQLIETIRDETIALTRRQFDVRFPSDRQISGNWELERMREGLDQLLADPEVDLVVAVGIYVTGIAAKLQAPPKPVIGTLALDTEVQGLPVETDAEGRLVTGAPNLTYLVTPGSTLRDLAEFKEITRVSKIHILTDSLIFEAIPGIVEYSATGEDQIGIDLELVPAARSADEALAGIPRSAEAVYITPLLRFSPDELARLISGLIDRRLPTMSLLGRPEVERGVMLGLRPGPHVPRLARRVALNIQRILLGEKAEDLPIFLGRQEKLIINMETARAIDAPLRWRVLIEAEILNEREPFVRTLTMDEAVAEAIEANLALRAKASQVAAGAEEVQQARALLRPLVDLTAQGVQIDEDRAAASFGSTAERTVSGTASLSQIIYSDAARANVEIAERLQSALELDRESLRLDIALDAASAFLDVLRAETLHSVERENRSLTESNLQLARRRQEIGFSGPADVYRWESELATDTSAVIVAENRVRSARVRLNRILNRPQEENFEARPPALEDPTLLSGYGRMATFLDTQQGVELFRDFMVSEALANSPEVRGLDAAIAARERTLLAARRSYWAPDVVLFGEVARNFSKGGEGSQGSPASPFPLPDRDTWSVGVSATLPLFAGGERKSLVRQSTEELIRLRLERDGLAEGIELRARAAMYEASGTFPAIELAQEAAEAARKNLDLVTDAYSRGALSIIDLLDAQNAALVAEQFAANAVYDFLLDLMELQRAANNFGFLMSEDGREAWYERLESFYVENGGRLPPSIPR